LVEVPIDFRPLGIVPNDVATNYVPARDCNDCPDEVTQLMGWGSEHGLPGGNPDNSEVRGGAATPLNSDANIQQAGIMTFNQVSEAGDSGGPVYRYNAARRRFEVVGLILGVEEQANAEFEVDPDGPGQGNTPASSRSHSLTH